jgi:hypothetical protein
MAESFYPRLFWSAIFHQQVAKRALASAWRSNKAAATYSSSSQGMRAGLGTARHRRLLYNLGAKVTTVAELGCNIKGNGLIFVTATPGDEAAYQSLYEATVNCAISLSQLNPTMAKEK